MSHAISNDHLFQHSSSPAQRWENKIKKVLLINPDFHPGETKARAFSANLASLPFLNARSFIGPLSLATVAALTPDDADVDIWDKGVHGLINGCICFEKDYDIVRISGYSARSERVKKLGQILPTRGILVTVGGASVSVNPEN